MAPKKGMPPKKSKSAKSVKSVSKTKMPKEAKKTGQEAKKTGQEAKKKITKDMGIGEFFDTIYPAKARWATMAVFGVLCISFIVVSCILYYKEINVDYKSVEDQFDKLRRSIAEVRHQDELHRAEPPKTAAEVGKLKTYIEEQQKLLEKRKAEYRQLYTLGERTTRSWTAHGKNFYYYSKGKKSWYDAEKFCMSRDSHLISILHEEEQKFISSQIKEPIWIGLTDEKEKGMWDWTDSSRFRIQYWSNAKPDHSVPGIQIEKHCASLSPSPNTYNWNRDDCYTLKKWVCKKTLEVHDD